MKNMIDFLSGNVPGGIGLYLLLVAVIFLVLFGISRRNELFTSRLFKIWFGGVWFVLTLAYIGWWMSDPHPVVLSRYSVIFFTEDENDRWLAYYFRDEVNESLQPARSKINYLYPQRWNYFAGIECAQSPGDCQEIARKLPLKELVTGEIKKENGQYSLLLNLQNPGNNNSKTLGETQFSPETVDKALPAILSRLNPSFPVRSEGIIPSLPDKDLALAKDAFYREEYQQSLELCRRALARYPDHPEILKWYHYNRLRQAKALRLQEKKDEGNPFDSQKKPWQLMAMEARAFLVNLFKSYYDRGIGDVMLANMIAESFIMDERYGDAEEFLKIAYFENPFNVEVLENLSLLHDSRYKDLPFRNSEEILAWILDICPLHQGALTAYVEKMLADVPVNSVPSVKIRERVNRALALNPNSAAVLILRGRYNLMAFRYPEALRDFTKADSLEPNDAVVQYNLGVVYFKLKDYHTAENYFQKAVQLSDYLEAHLYLGAIYKERGEYEKALERFRYRVAHKQGDDDYYALQAMKGIRECLEALNIPIPQ